MQTPSLEEIVDSPMHAGGDDLDTLALDVGCGAGHVAFRLAPLVGRVTACDLSTEMLTVEATEARTRGLENLVVEQGTAERLPFADATFDLLTTRYSAHHWAAVGSTTGGQDALRHRAGREHHPGYGAHPGSVGIGQAKLPRLFVSRVRACVAPIACARRVSGVWFHLARSSFSIDVRPLHRGQSTRQPSARSGRLEYHARNYVSQTGFGLTSPTAALAERMDSAHMLLADGPRMTVRGRCS